LKVLESLTKILSVVMPGDASGVPMHDAISDSEPDEKENE
jgi:hypothetical protein